MAEILHFDSEKERLAYLRGKNVPKELKPMKKGKKRGTSKKKLSSD